MAIQRALLSVSNKMGIVELARELHLHNIELLSTGGTAQTLRDADLPVTEISELTHFPEMMDGRLKTLHPLVHGGILNRRDNPIDREQMRQHGIVDIDMVVVNLYPFGEAIQQPDITWEKAVEMIDIGGPTMLRAAAKNHQFVTALCDPNDYALVAEMIHHSGEVPLEKRRYLAIKALRHTAYYDAQISTWLGAHSDNVPELYPKEFSLGLLHHMDLRYGENPHQSAAVYRQMRVNPPSMLTARQLHGKELSYNNFNDSNAALEIMMEFDRPVAVAVKHANPCAVAVGSTLAEAFARCHAADPISIYGGIVALNRKVDAETAALLRPIVLDMVIAPSFSPEALEILTSKRDLRLMELGPQETWSRHHNFHLQTIRGGFLLQSPDILEQETAAWKTVTNAEPLPSEKDDLLFAWAVVKHVRSNAIVVAKNGQTLGLGIGQVNRIDAVRHALQQAGSKAADAVLASDAFFPFDDSIIEAGSHGIRTIIQPGGSIRDEECIRTANDLEIAMIFTGMRHFRH